jgi:hypothetical protein
MALEIEYHNTRTAIHSLQERLFELQTTVSEDGPSVEDSVLVELMMDALDEALGWLEAADQRLGEGEQFVRLNRPDVYQAALALVQAQAFAQRMSQGFRGRLTGFEHFKALEQFGQERGPEWQAWSQSVLEGLFAGSEAIRTLEQAFLGCWHEMVERIGSSAIPVQLTTINEGNRSLSNPERSSS